MTWRPTASLLGFGAGEPSKGFRKRRASKTVARRGLRWYNPLIAVRPRAPGLWKVEMQQKQDIDVGYVANLARIALDDGER